MSLRLLKILSVFVMVALLAATITSIVAAPPAQDVVACEEVVNVMNDDWLSKLADKYYGNVLAYPAIFEATNAKAHVDDSYARLDDVNQIRVGQKLCIPSAEDAEMLLKKWDGLHWISSGCALVESRRFVTSGPFRLEPGQAFVDGEILVTGLITDVNTVITDTRLVELELEPIASISYAGIARAQDPSFPPPLRFPRGRAGDLTTRLYRISSSDTVVNTIHNVYRVVGALSEAGRLEAWVYAEPNYVTSNPISSEEWDPGGSPLPGVTGTATTAAFYDQWALGVVSGTHLIGPNGRTVSKFGDGTQVVIMDTSPFYQPGLWGFGAPRWSQQQEGAQAMLRICVSHPMPVYPPESPVTYTNVSEHGVFVAGLVHAVAPHSQIHLVRVLNDEGQGTLFSLAEALTGVISTTLQSKPVEGQGSLEKTVINLSLGLHPPENPEEVGITEDELKMIREQTDAIAASLPADARAILESLPPNDSDRIPMIALETPLAIAHSYGAVIVAAAGNESEMSPAASPEPPLRPASYAATFVIGVAGSDQGLGRSCFSNAGDIAAPAGGLEPGQESPLACTPQVFTNGLNNCSLQGNVDCPYGVVSFSPSVTTTGYALWPGTSFAAPQVSGLAALLLEEGGVPAQEVFTKMLTTSVTGANLGQPIIDVEQAVP